MNAPASPSRVRFGVFELDADRGELRKDGVAVRIAPQPFAVLQLLLARAGEIVTREELVRHVWGTDTFVDFDRGLNFCIAQVRAALGDDTAKPIYVQTLPKRGYRFIAPVTREGPPAILSSPGPVAVPAAASADAHSLRRYRVLAFIGGGVVIVSLLLIVVLAALGFVRRDDSAASTTATSQSPTKVVAVAVLPFEDLTPNAAAAGGGTDADRFSDGLTDELIGTLGRAAPTRLTVIARTSVMKYRHTKADVREIGRDLHVDFIVEGSVRRDASRAQAEARLVDVRTRRTVWSQKFSQRVEDEFDLQTAMATSIAGGVSGHFIQPVKMAAPPDVSTAAGERYMNGRYLLRKGDPGSLARAADEFRTAIALDGRFAAAQAALTEALLAQVLTGARPAREVADEAQRAADQAMALDPMLPDALVAMGLVDQWINWKPDDAETMFRRALGLNPSHAAAHHDLAWALLAQAEVEGAVTAITRAFELDPLSTRASLDIGWVYLRARKYDEAIAHCRRTLSLEPDNPGAQGCLEQGFRKTGRLAEAWMLASRGPRSKGAVPPGDDEARLGLQRVTEQRLQRMMALATGDASASVTPPAGSERPRRYVSSYQIATLHAMLGDADAAFRWLERAFEEHDNSLVLLPVDPEWDGVRADPRLARLIERVRAARDAKAVRRACGGDPRRPCAPV